MTCNENRSLYLSRLLLNPRSRQVRSELAQPYEMHRTLMHAFEKQLLDQEESPRKKVGVLFRTEVDESRRCIIVYVQSLIEPDWSFLSAVRNYLSSDSHKLNPACKDVSGAYSQLQVNQTFSFRLRANPTKRIARVAGGNPKLKGKRVGLLREEDQISWLVRKGQEREIDKPGGFELLTQHALPSNTEAHDVPLVRVRQEGKQGGRKRGNGRSHTTTHLSVLFDGILRITDADNFRETLTRGIGSAKAYGFGLLSIGPSDMQ